jgi:crotonobetainyl-CoA:carnitine CoA-transferase CaiB-like acyl-CoA transferase
MIDLLAAHQLKEGVLIALLHRERTGEGSTLATSLMESALVSLVNQASNYLMNGIIPQRMGSQHPNIAPYGDIFSSSDGFLVLLAVGTERQFQQLCTCLSLQFLLEKVEFQTNTARVEHRAELNTYLAAAILRRTLDDLMATFKDHAVPAARIRNLQQVFEMPTAQDMILEESMANGVVTRRVKTVGFLVG